MVEHTNDKVFSHKSKKYRQQYLDTLSKLYSDTPTTKSEPKALKPQRKRRLEATESQIQIAFSKWLTLNKIRHSASANGGKRNLFEAVRLKKMGVSAGFPDIEIPIPNDRYHGLYIEMKTKIGIVAPQQQDWILFLRSVGHKAEIAYGLEEAKQIVNDYFNLPAA